MLPPRILLFLLALPLDAGHQVSALEITEILTENDGGLQDADLTSPGWIELHNESASAANIGGWRLTDDPALPAKWILPAQQLAAGAYLVVFTSGKNRAAAGAELHTNFQLDPDGEYLALVRPDGTIAQQYAPALPKLRRNVSYAVTTASLTTPLVTESSACRYFVPSGAALGTTWTAAAFSDGSWDAGTCALGYDAAGTTTRIDVKSLTSAASIPSPSGWSSFTFPGIADSGTSTATTSTATVSGITVKLDAAGAGLVLASRNRQGGATDIMVNAAPLNNVAEDFVFASTSSYLAGTPRGMNVTISGLPVGSTLPVTIWAYDRGSPATRQAVWTDPLSGNSGSVSFDGSNGQLADEAAFNVRSVTINAQSNASGQIMLEGRAGPGGSTSSHNVFLNAIQVGTLTFTPLISTNVSAAMQNVNSSLYARSTFTLTNPENYDRLRLRVRYDDGFYAWVNGQLIATRNAPAPPVWNAAASSDRPKVTALTQEEIIIPVAPGLLTAGSNVLALQGLSQSAADSDFLLSASLDALGTTPPAGYYFATPTPGAANSTAYNGLVRDTAFSVDRGFFTAPFTSTITCPTPGAQIRYTVDGSAPTATTGLNYTGPVSISGTTVLRAAAFVPGFIPSNVDAQSYIFTSQVVGQPANPPGWPATWGTNPEVNTNDGAGDGTVPGNYEMDPAVAASTIPGYSVVEALEAIPSLSLCLAPSDFLGPNGIYQNPQSIGIAWERACSIEFMDPTRVEGDFHETCKVEIHGNSSRRPWRMQKHSMRVTFSSDYGPPKLSRNLFPGSGLKQFNQFILRGCFTDSWGLVSWDQPRYRPDDSVYFRDIWMRRSHEAMGEPNADSRHVHLYVNGLYWGVFNITQRFDEDTLADRLGGLPSDYQVVSDFVDPDPSATSQWKTLFNLMVNAGSLIPRAAYEAALTFVDPVRFADYYLLHVFADAEDWPHHNGYAWRRTTGPDQRYHWAVWDQEIALDNHAIDRLSPSAGNTATDRTPGRLYQRMRENPEFRLLMADRAHALFHNQGPLNLAACQARWSAAAAELDKAIVAESARWGDTADDTPYGTAPTKLVYTREGDWLPTVNMVRDTWLPGLYDNANSFAVIRKLQAQGLYPVTEPPALSLHGGNVAVNFPLTISAAAGTIYYTLNGSDPREAWTGNATGTIYSGPVSLTQTGVIKARALNGSEWSALTEATFIVGTAAAANNIAISEICYNPPVAGAWEFIEIMNISSGPVDLTNAGFTTGIEFTFAPGTILAAGQRLVLAADAAAFAAQFPGAALHGIYTGKLDNNGEEIALTAANGADIRRFTWNDKLPWPAAADGNGSSLTLIAPRTNPDHANPLNWRAGTTPGGSPGTSDSVAFSGNALADSDGDGLSDLLEYALAFPTIEPAFLPDGTSGIMIHRRAGADDAAVVIESSANLNSWTPLPAASLRESSPPAAGEYTEIWTPAPGSERVFLRARVQLH